MLLELQLGYRFFIQSRKLSSPSPHACSKICQYFGTILYLSRSGQKPKGFGALGFKKINLNFDWRGRIEFSYYSIIILENELIISGTTLTITSNKLLIEKDF